MSVPYPSSAHGLLPSEMFDDGVWCAGMSLPVDQFGESICLALKTWHSVFLEQLLIVIPSLPHSHLPVLVCLLPFRWQGMAVEAAAPGTADFVPAPSVYARYSNAPFAVQGIFQVGLTAPPQMPFTNTSPLFSPHHPATVSEDHEL